MAPDPVHARHEPVARSLLKCRSMMQVLVADDDDDVRASVALALDDAGHHVTQARDGAQALELISSRVFDLAICDVQMPKLDGMALFRRIRREAPGTAIVMMTSFAKIPDAVGSVRDGAVDYVTKPFDPDEFAQRIVQPILERRSLRKKFEEARAEFVGRATGVALVAASPATQRVAERIALLANSEAPVLITGGRGVGKELVARTIHAQGCRREGPFVLLDGGRLADVLSASERGEHGADGAARDLWFRRADGGTLVLDEVDTLAYRAQAQLLQVIAGPGARARRNAQWEPLGVRLITLARAGLGGRAAPGHLLESLHYRLNGVHLYMPSLNERREDLLPLVAGLLRELEPPGRTPSALTPAAWRALSSYSFPGNVRELRWVLEHALAMANGEPIDVSHLPPEVLGSLPPELLRAS